MSAARPATSARRRWWWAGGLLLVAVLLGLLVTQAVRWGSPSLSVEPPVVHAGDTATVRLDNTTTGTLLTGVYYDLVRREGDDWIPVEGAGGGILVGVMVRPFGTQELALPTQAAWPAGTYRVEKGVSVGRDQEERLELTAEFELRHLSDGGVGAGNG